MALPGNQFQGFRNGDRVRVCEPEGEYSGCRGTIVDAPESSGQQCELPLGYMVAIDGENGVSRPFLIQHLEALQLASVPKRLAERPGDEARDLGRA